MTTEPRDGSDAEATPAPPTDPEQLRQDIERTREELGETVEALIAKADVKARARERVGELSGRLREATTQAREQATAKVGQARSQIAGRSADAKHAAAGTAVPTDQLQARAAAVGQTLRGATPDPVQKAAQRAMATASQRRVMIAAAAVGVVVVGFVLVRRWRR